MRHLLILLLLLSAAVHADGIFRNLPPQARLAQMGPPYGNQVALNGKVYRLAPGSQIRDARNLIVLPMSLQDMPGEVPVRFLLDSSGEIIRIWMLTPEEQRAAEKD
jgi:hypothetical protein